jgi:hypothetical protein
MDRCQPLTLRLLPEWSNSSRAGLFLLLDQDALSRRTTPSMYGITCSLRDGCTYLQQIPKFLWDGSVFQLLWLRRRVRIYMQKV